MKFLQYIVILLFSLASLLMGGVSYGQKTVPYHYYLISYISKDKGIINDYGTYFVKYYGVALSQDSLKKYACTFVSRDMGKKLDSSYYIHNIEIMGIHEFKTKREWEYYQTGK
jgi:hypothetical protein